MNKATLLPALFTAMFFSLPAFAVPTPLTFSGVDSWGDDGSPNNVTTSGQVSEAWIITGLQFQGTVSPTPYPQDTTNNPFGLTNDTWGSELSVNIVVDGMDLGAFQLGSGDAIYGDNTVFSGTLNFVSAITLSALDSLSFRFFETLDDWGFWGGLGFLTPASNPDATWDSIKFSFLGRSPDQNGGGGNGTVPEPATLALLGLGLLGLGAMRLRVS